MNNLQQQEQMMKDAPVLGGQLTLEVSLVGLGEHIWFWVGSIGSTLFRRIPATPCPDSLSAFLSPPQPFSSSGEMP
ncbi:MAG: hypothetical protein ACFCU9_12750 [Cyanophyceae cyanobacterium]